MIKILFYGAIVYLAYKIYQMLRNSRVEVHYHDHRKYYSGEEETPEKENPAGKKAGSSKNSLDKAGDYVDFEEVKD